MNGLKLVWSAISVIPDEWLIDHMKSIGYTTEELTKEYSGIVWETTDNIDDIIEHEIGCWTRYAVRISELQHDRSCKVKSHIKILIRLFVIRKRTFQVLETDSKNRSIREVYSIPLSKLPERYVYVGVRDTYYIVGKHESDVLKNTPVTVLKLPIYHKGGPTYSFRCDVQWSDYNDTRPVSIIYNKDKEFYYDIESTFPRDPQGYYDKCMELIAGEIREYSRNGTLIDSIWEYWCIDRKGHEDFMNPETFQEMMEMKWPIFWYIDEFTDLDIDEEELS